MKKLAIIQFGPTKGITKTFEAMANKKREEGWDVPKKIIDMLKRTKEQKDFLASEDLEQINIMGHSASWDEADKLIPVDKRMLNDTSIEEVCKKMKRLAKRTSATIFKFYPCEIADKIGEGGVESRDMPHEEGIFSIKNTMSIDKLSQLKADLKKQLKETPNSVSCLDKLKLAIIEGKVERLKKLAQNSNQKNPKKETVVIGGQVGPGYPDKAKNAGSPRETVARQIARKILEKDPEESKKAIKKADKASNKLKSNKSAGPRVWEQSSVTLFFPYRNNRETSTEEFTIRSSTPSNSMSSDSDES